MPSSSCPTCGSPLQESALFCGECGASVAAPTVASTPVQSEPEQRPRNESLSGPHSRTGATSDGSRRASGIGSVQKVTWIKVGLAGALVLIFGGVGAAQLTSGRVTPASLGATPTPQSISPPSPSSSITELSRPTGNDSPSASSSPATSESSPSPTATPSSLATTVATDLPDFAAAGWDSSVLDRAYCQNEGQFVTLADTQNFRGVICARNGVYEYRGMDKQNGLTITTLAEKTANGYAGIDSGTRYELGPNSFDIMDETGELSSEAVLTWLTPDEDPFIPGELGLSEPISFPECDGTGVVILSNNFGVEASKIDIQSMLDLDPSIAYIRTDLSCDSFNRPSSDRSGGDYIYASYVQVGKNISDLCDVASTENGTAVWLLNDISPDEARVDCP